MEIFLNNPEFESKLTYINGNPMSAFSHMACDLINAKTCILLSNKNSKDPVGMDHKNILIGLAVKKYMREYFMQNPKSSGNPDMSLCMQLIKPESKQHYFSSISKHTNQD